MSHRNKTDVINLLKWPCLFFVWLVPNKQEILWINIQLILNLFWYSASGLFHKVTGVMILLHRWCVSLFALVNFNHAFRAQNRSECQIPPAQSGGNNLRRGRQSSATKRGGLRKCNKWKACTTRFRLNIISCYSTFILWLHAHSLLCLLGCTVHFPISRKSVKWTLCVASVSSWELAINFSRNPFNIF